MTSHHLFYLCIGNMIFFIDAGVVDCRPLFFVLQEYISPLRDTTRLYQYRNVTASYSFELHMYWTGCCRFFCPGCFMHKILNLKDCFTTKTIHGRVFSYYCQLLSVRLCARLKQVLFPLTLFCRKFLRAVT